MPRFALGPFLAAALLGLALSPAARAADMAVDLELVLAVDISFSMDEDEQQLQRDGYVAAITNPDVIAAIGRGLNGRIALSYVEWAGPERQRTVVDWRVVDGAASAQAFAAALAEAPLAHFRGTSISGSLAFLKPRFEGNGFEAPRHVIDVSGDGPNNMGAPVEAARDRSSRPGSRSTACRS